MAASSIMGTLHQTHIGSAAFALQKEGGHSASANSAFLGVSVAEHGKREFGFPVLRAKKVTSKNTNVARLRALY